MNKDIHKINNYIRNNTRISNEDRTLFIAILLIGIKDDLFININIDEILSILHKILDNYDIQTDIFQSLISRKDKEHIYNLIKLIDEIYQTNKSIDLLNTFYMEFAKYNNSDGKSLGIVLTPHHIVRLMSEILNINSNDIVLDLCAGTGSFLLEAYKYKPKQIIGCEYQHKLCMLFKCNIIIKGIINYILIKGNCFDNIFKSTKSLINPPYGTKQNNELEFVVKQIESLEIDGECCAIIPIGKVLNNKTNNKYKKQILSISILKSIIICRESIFYPNASVGCVIVHFKKTSFIIENNLTGIIDYRNDGFIPKSGNGYVKSDNFEEIYNNTINEIRSPIIQKILKYDDDWYNTFIIEDKKINLKKLKLSKLELNYINTKFNILNIDSDSDHNDIEFKKFELSYLFDILKKPKEKYTEQTKKVYMISAKNNNNGVDSIIDSNEKTFKGNKLVLITGGNGGAGLCYYQKNDFNIKSATVVLSPKNIIMNDHIGLYLSQLLSKNKEIYSRYNTWTQKKIKSTIINLPINQDESINYNYIESLFE